MKSKGISIFLITILFLLLSACSNSDGLTKEDRNKIKNFQEAMDEKNVVKMEKIVKSYNNLEEAPKELIELSDRVVDDIIHERDFGFMLEHFGEISVINSISEKRTKFKDFITEEKINLEKSLKVYAENNDYAKFEAIITNNELIEKIDLSVLENYLLFMKSDEPMSLRTARLIDSVEYGYSGLLNHEVSQAIYSPHEENSLARDTGRKGFDELDWKYNEKKDKYIEYSNYNDLTVLAEIEEKTKKDLIEQAKGQNPAIGMTKEEVEASLWGKPEKINRTVTKYSTREQWVYGNRQYLYFTDGILTSFQD